MILLDFKINCILPVLKIYYTLMDVRGMQGIIKKKKNTNNYLNIYLLEGDCGRMIEIYISMYEVPGSTLVPGASRF